jgi:hypothetical protein
MKATARALHVAPPDSGYMRSNAGKPLFESLAVHDVSAADDLEPRSRPSATSSALSAIAVSLYDLFFRVVRSD